ncbi:DEAD/DEAH box helicase [Corynebacterium sp. CCM 9204]|uniref:DEAD/DEAH box helicase n=1 Tax=Corynebacterium sp. CCM 9204 TaxID=3057616 RepID=UPI0035232977
MAAIRSLGDEIGAILATRLPESHCTFSITTPPRPARHGHWPEWVHPPLQRHLSEEEDIQRLFIHQEQCARLAWEGRHVVVSTGTSSGKSLGYLLPILSTLATDTVACALYLTPTKALGSDQLATASRLSRNVDGLGGIHPAPYDGDTPHEVRHHIRDTSRMIFTNPDMCHTSILANHARWARVLRHLAFVVIDECHTYRGIFGANVALVLRRLRRICSRYGSSPVFILTSATIADPGGHASRLVGLPMETVTDDGAPTGSRTVLLWEPGFIAPPDDTPTPPSRRAASAEAALIMASSVSEGARTLTFVHSRRGAEAVALRCADELSKMGRRDLAERIAAYRAGYLAADRRRLERQLDDGTLLGVASTNALELGIDVGGLDAVITAGFPGTVASFRQQAGRAGRRGQESIVVFIARDDPMDTYLVHHPEALLGSPIEQSVFDPSNPYVLRGHLYCAAVEFPLTEADLKLFEPHSGGSPSSIRDTIDTLTTEGFLRKRPRGWFAVDRLTDDEIGVPQPHTAHASVSLRGGANGEITIVDSEDGRLLGTVDATRAVSQVHPGAVYLHQGESFVVDDLLLDDHLALAHTEIPDYTTFARSTTDIRITGDPTEGELHNPFPGLWVANVDVEVTEQVTGYVMRLMDGTVLDQVPLDYPAQQLKTRAVAYTIDPATLAAMGLTPADLPGTLHAAEHAAIGMLPLIATCDRWDIGGVSTALHPDTGLPTVFVYDGHPGGAGFADCGFTRFREWITATFEAVRACPCEDGCPSCVQSPKCGNGNSPLDKQGALKLLGAMVTMLSGH